MLVMAILQYRMGNAAFFTPVLERAAACLGGELMVKVRNTPENRLTVSPNGKCAIATSRYLHRRNENKLPHN